MSDRVDRTWRQLLGTALAVATGAGLAVTVGTAPAHAVPPGTYAYVANSHSGSVSAIDTATNTVTATIPVGGGPTGVALSPDGTRAYVGSQGSNTVSVIDTATDAVTATIPVPAGPRQVVLTADGSRAYVTDQEAGVVSAIDTATNTVTAIIPVDGGPIGLALTPDATRAYVADNSAQTVSVIDTTTNTVSATIPVGVGPQDLGITPDGSRVFVADGSGSVISTTTNTVVGHTGVGGTFGVAFSPDGTRAYITNDLANTVEVVDTATDAVIDNIPVGAFPLRVALTPDGSRIYVTNQNSDWVSVIDAATNTLVENVPVGSAPYGIAVAVVPPPKAPQTITFAQPASPAFYGTSAALDATASSGLPVTFSADAASTPGTCTIAHSTVTYTGVGTCVIDAEQEGNTAFLAAQPVRRTVTVNPAPITATGQPASVLPGLFQATFVVTVRHAITNAPAPGEPVTVRATSLLGQTKSCTAVTDATGTARCTVTGLIPLAPLSTYRITVPATTDYQAGSGTGRVVLLSSYLV